MNPHGIATTRSLVLLVCQFRHFRITHTILYHARMIITSSQGNVNMILKFVGIFYTLKTVWEIEHHCSMSEKSWSRDFSGILPSLIFRTSWHDWVMESVIVQGRDAVTDCICSFSFFICDLVCGLFFIRILPC